MNHALTRRHLLRSSIASSAGLAGAALLAACGGSGAPAASTSSVAGSATLSSSSAAPAASSAATSVASSSQTTSQAATSSAPQPTATSAPKAQAAAPAANPQAVTYTTPDVDPLLAHEKQAIDEFMQKHPTIKVDVQTFPDAPDFYEKLKVLFAAGVMPDVLNQETKYLPGHVYQKMIMELTAMMNTAGIKQDDFWPLQWKKHELNGKMWGIPIESEEVVVFYNKDLFQKYGVTPPPTKWDDPSWTWDALLEAATKLTQGADAAKTWGFNASTWWVYDYPMIWGYGGTVLNADHSKSTLSTPATLDALQFRADLLNRYRVHPLAADLKEGLVKMFGAGRIAMNMTWCEWAYYIKDVPNLNFEMAPTPRGKAGAFTRAPSDCITINSQTKHRDDAFTVAQYLTSLDGIKTMVASVGLVPALKAALPNYVHPQDPKVANLNWQVAVDAEAQGHVQAQDVTIKWTEMDTLLRKEHDVLLANKETAQDFAAKVEPQINALLDSIPADQRGFIGD